MIAVDPAAIRADILVVLREVGRPLSMPALADELERRNVISRGGVRHDSELHGWLGKIVLELYREGALTFMDEQPALPAPAPASTVGDELVAAVEAWIAWRFWPGAPQVIERVEAALAAAELNPMSQLHHQLAVAARCNLRAPTGARVFAGLAELVEVIKGAR